MRTSRTAGWWWGAVAAGLLAVAAGAQEPKASAAAPPAVTAATAPTAPGRAFRWSDLATLEIRPEMLSELVVTWKNGAVLSRVPVFKDYYGRTFRHGVLMEYSPDGKPLRSVGFRYGMQTRNETRWSPTGELEFQSTCDETDGLTVRRYDATGKLVEEKRTPAAEVAWQAPEVLPLMTERMVTAAELKEFRQANQAGQVTLRFDYYENEYGVKVKHGKLTIFYPNGKPRRETEYLHGMPHGKDLWWHASGVRWMEMELEHGRLVGTRKTYDEEGKLVTEQATTAGG